MTDQKRGGPERPCGLRVAVKPLLQCRGEREGERAGGRGAEARRVGRHGEARRGEAKGEARCGAARRGTAGGTARRGRQPSPSIIEGVGVRGGPSRAGSSQSQRGGGTEPPPTHTAGKSGKPLQKQAPFSRQKRKIRTVTPTRALYFRRQCFMRGVRNGLFQNGLQQAV